MTNKPEVTQADREAALNLLQGAAPEGLDDGRRDSLSLVQAFAAHREQAVAALQAENARLLELLSCALDEHDGIYGKRSADRWPVHWSTKTRQTLTKENQDD